MKTIELQEIVLDALELDDNEVYTDKEFLMHLNGVLRGITLDMLNKDLTSYINLKKKTINLDVTNTPGTRGYQGLYKLPEDLLQIKQVHVSLDGNCWIDTKFTSKDLGYDYKCNNCPCKGPQCGIDLRRMNNEFGDYIQIRPIPKVPVRKGLIIQYSALPTKLKDIDSKLPFKETDQDYVALLVVDYYMAVHSDKYSQTKVNRVFNKFNRSKGRFDKLHNLQTRGRIQKNHDRPTM